MYILPLELCLTKSFLSSLEKAELSVHKLVLGHFKDAQSVGKLLRKASCIAAGSTARMSGDFNDTV